jgi:hypothetical protein
MTWYMRSGTGVERPPRASTSEVEPSERSTSVAMAASARDALIVRAVFMPGTVGGAPNRPATGR